ncbi:MAG: ABC transporter permease [Propionibacteriaceae bacterium]|jgi:NitT/TauT family transport system permease protein|nr:ABC transporter permease [Propionibacteriaceae bacterium]
MTKASKAWVGFVAPFSLAIALVATWWGFTAYSGVPKFLLPEPRDVILRFFAEVFDAHYWGYLGQTLAEAMGGCVVGALVALPLAALIHRSKWVCAAVNPFLGATQAIPAIALAPLLVLWVGYDMRGVVILCALMVFFPILVSTVLGLRHVSRDVVEAAHIDGASSLRLLVEIEAPLALPSALAGLRNGFTLSITGAVVGEMVMGGHGLGTLLTVQRDAVDTSGMFATIALLCVVAATIYSLIHLVERRSRLVQTS